MTREEAIIMLERLKDRINFEVTDSQKKMDALNMAIKALEQESKEYEQTQNEIKVGDEVYFIDETWGFPRVITCIKKENGKNPVAVQLTKSGRLVEDDVTELHKTGRHFDQIEDVLKALKEA